MILHIDMDAFFASVEQLDNPELRGRPVIVGGHSKRGVVSTASYEARKFGVHSAMPIFQAKQKCPEGIIIPPRGARYKELSIKIMAALHDFSPLVEPVSIDEAYVDISGCERIHGTPEETATRVKQKIYDTVNLNCSVGIAPTKFLAKIASDMDKPNGLTIIPHEKVTEFIDTLPVQKVPGVGKATFQQLERLGIKTLGDVQRLPKKIVMEKFGKYGKRLIELASGIDRSRVIPYSTPRSVSSEITLSENTCDKELLKKHMLNQAEEVGRELRKKGVKGKTISIKIKHADFKQVTRSVTLFQPTQSSVAIYKESSKLLDAYNINKNVRLIGVGVSGLLSVDTPVQMELFGADKKKNAGWEKVDSVVDAITEKFGKGSIKKAGIADVLK